MARNRGGIYVPQTGTIYPSITAASKALGVDASNIGKVVRGARVSAGGYNFQRVDLNVDQSLLRDIDEALREQSTPKQRERMERTRRKNESRLSPEERQRRKEKRAAAERLHKILVGANKAIKEMQKQGVSGYSDAVTELENLKALIGKSKSGAFDTSIRNLMNLSAGEINAAIKATEKQTERLQKTDAENLKKRRAAVALQFGVSQEELEKYDDALPVLWELLALARQQQGNGYSRALYDAVVDSVQYAEDPEDLKATLEKIRDEYQGAIEDEQDVDLSDILQRGTEELQGLYETPEEAATEELEDDWMSGWVDLPTDPDNEE
jgi:hypothetical protein